MDFILRTLKYAGAFTAVILCIGFISKGDYGLFSSQGVSSVEEMSLFSGDENSSVASYNENGKSIGSGGTAMRIKRNRPSDPTTGNFDRERAVSSPTSADRSSSSRPHKTERSMSALDIEEWIQMNVAQSYLEAENKTMSPGVILATGVYFLQQGKGDNDMSAADVAAYLNDLRQSASSKAKKHMKYIANSDEWFKGLNLAGFDGNQIASIFNNHELGAYDKQMFARHVEKKIEQENYTIEDGALAADLETNNKNLAEAYNSYAERGDVRKKYSLPTLAASKPIDHKELSEGRKEAQSFIAGQSKTYDNPRIFWSVLKEMIALEHDYQSWDDYKADHKRAADKEFQRRSDIMATGGIMKVTRRGV